MKEEIYITEACNNKILGKCLHTNNLERELGRNVHCVICVSQYAVT